MGKFRPTTLYINPATQISHLAKREIYNRYISTTCWKMPLFQSMGARGLIFNPTLHAVVERVPLKDVLLLTSSYIPSKWLVLPNQGCRTFGF